MSWHRGATLWSVVAIGWSSVLVSGCGQGSADPDGPTVTVRVTRTFGHDVFAAENQTELRGRKTLLSTLRDHHEVELSEEGLGVDAIDGLRHRLQTDANRTEWSTTVNGVETDVPAPDYKLFDGDVGQWDLRPWETTLDVRATVGAFPQTFTRGVFGKTFPVALRCEQRASQPCRTVKRALRRAGVPINRPSAASLPPPGNPQRARVLVGAWADLL